MVIRFHGFIFKKTFEIIPPTTINLINEITSGGKSSIEIWYNAYEY